MKSLSRLPTDDAALNTDDGKGYEVAIRRRLVLRCSRLDRLTIGTVYESNHLFPMAALAVSNSLSVVVRKEELLRPLPFGGSVHGTKADSDDDL